jgi:hypothetical protein
VKNDVNVPSKSKKQKNSARKFVFVDVLKVTDENSKIRIHYSEIWIHGSGSAPKFHGSATLLERFLFSWKTDKESVRHYGDIRPAARQAFWANIDFRGMGKEGHCS